MRSTTDSEPAAPLDRSVLSAMRLLDAATLGETIASYNATAKQYALQFKDADLGRYMERFVRALPAQRASVLDAGCGPGRDCARFEALGLDVIGLDLSIGLLLEARAVSNCALVQGDLCHIPLRPGSVDGVWSCASLVHLAPKGLRRAIGEFRSVLRTDGVLFASLRYGVGDEWRADSAGGRRYFRFYKEPELESALLRNGFEIESLTVEPGVVSGVWMNVFARVSS